MVQTQMYSLPPRYTDPFSRCIGVLQHLQTLMSSDATLDDVALLVQRFQQEFGAQEQLENVIQSLVCYTLEKQVTRQKMSNAYT